MCQGIVIVFICRNSNCPTETCRRVFDCIRSSPDTKQNPLPLLSPCQIPPPKQCILGRQHEDGYADIEYIWRYGMRGISLPAFATHENKYKYSTHIIDLSKITCSQLRDIMLDPFPPREYCRNCFTQANKRRQRYLISCPDAVTSSCSSSDPDGLSGETGSSKLEPPANVTGMDDVQCHVNPKDRAQLQHDSINAMQGQDQETNGIDNFIDIDANNAMVVMNSTLDPDAINGYGQVEIDGHQKDISMRYTTDDADSVTKWLQENPGFIRNWLPDVLQDSRNSSGGNGIVTRSLSSGTQPQVFQDSPESMQVDDALPMSREYMKPPENPSEDIQMAWTTGLTTSLSGRPREIGSLLFETNGEGMQKASDMGSISTGQIVSAPLDSALGQNGSMIGTATAAAFGKALPASHPPGSTKGEESEVPTINQHAEDFLALRGGSDGNRFSSGKEWAKRKIEACKPYLPGLEPVPEGLRSLAYPSGQSPRPRGYVRLKKKVKNVLRRLGLTRSEAEEEEQGGGGEH